MRDYADQIARLRECANNSHEVHSKCGAYLSGVCAKTRDIRMQDAADAIEDCKEKWNKMSMRERLDTIAEHAELFPDRSKCVRLDLEPGDLRNIVELFEDQFFEHLRSLLDEGELDNIEYLRSMLRIYDQLRAAQAEEEA